MHGLSAHWQEFLPITPVLAQMGQIHALVSPNRERSDASRPNRKQTKS